ncbi:MAG: LptA/OstA family protein, partial [Edaphobacter sp.]
TEVHGDGHTSLRQVNATGVIHTSSADSLEAHFRPVADAGGRRARRGRKAGGDDVSRQGADEIVSAVEQGHVVMTQQMARKKGETSLPGEERATADRAMYDGELEKVTLIGNVQMTDAGSVLWADRVVTDQKSGDAVAEGSVKVSYLQPKGGVSEGGTSGGGTLGAETSGAGSEPVHVLAARAELKHESQVAIFHGAAGGSARLWQGASQVEAPVIQFEQKQKKLLAKGEGKGAAMAVHTVLTSGASAAKPEGVKTNSAKPGRGKTEGAKAGAGPGKVNLLRVTSRELVYSDETRSAQFSGGVRVESADGSMRGQQATVYLQGAPVAGSGTTGGRVSAVRNGFMGGGVERVVASGHVAIEQPGRRASGEQVVYTASDGMFVLTGTAGASPRIVDDAHGTVTGTSLRFHAGDQSVVVSNGGNGGAGQRVRTETRVKK